MWKKENVFKNIYQCRRRNVTKQHKIDPFSPLFVVCVCQYCRMECSSQKIKNDINKSNQDPFLLFG